MNVSDTLFMGPWRGSLNKSQEWIDLLTNRSWLFVCGLVMQQSRFFQERLRKTINICLGMWKCLGQRDLFTVMCVLLGRDKRKAVEPQLTRCHITASQFVSKQWCTALRQITAPSSQQMLLSLFIACCLLCYRAKRFRFSHYVFTEVKFLTMHQKENR